MLAGSGARLAIQGVYFILIARALGAEQYGAFVGVVALMAIVAPFASWGTGPLLIRNVARDPSSFSSSWGNALWMTSISGSVLLSTLLLLAKFVLSEKIPLNLVLWVGVSDLLLAAAVGVAAQTFQAVEQLHIMARAQIGLTAARAIAAVILVLLVSHPTAVLWGCCYCLSSALGAIYAIALVCSKLGFPTLRLRHLRSDLLEGFYFSISVSAQSVYNNIDKTMLVRLATFAAAGIYGAAYRLIDLSFQPVGALVYAAYPRFFQHGRTGLEGTRRLAARVLPSAIIYAIFAAVALMLLAPVVPLMFGRDFADSVGALRWLSPLVVFKACHYFLADALTGAGHQGIRSAIQIAIAALNILLNLWLIPAYSWRGAAWASLASDGLLVVGMFAVIQMLSRKALPSGPACLPDAGVSS